MSDGSEAAQPAPAGATKEPGEPGSPGELDALGYAEALAELESILTELESGEADIDHLAGRVGRAAELLDLCRGRLEGAQVEVTRILAGIDPVPDQETEPGAPTS